MPNTNRRPNDKRLYKRSTTSVSRAKLQQKINHVITKCYKNARGSKITVREGDGKQEAYNWCPNSSRDLMRYQYI